MISDYTLLAWRNVKKRKVRAWLTMIGIIISIATIFILISVSLGLRAAVTEQFRALGTDKFFIQPKGQLAGPGTSTASFLTDSDIEIIEKVSGIKDLSYFTVQPVKIEFADQVRFFSAIGIPKDHARVFEELGSYKPDEGRLIKYENSGEIMVGSDYKYNDLYRKPVHVGDTLLLNENPFKVKGILKPIGNPGDDRLVYMSLENFRILFPQKKDIDQVMVQVADSEQLELIADRVDRRLQQSRDVNEKTKDFTILLPQEILGSFGAILNILTSFLIGVAAISLLVGGIGIANTMYTSVLERTKEIGTMKAVGAQNKDILLIFLIESGMLGLTGGLIGVFIGIGVSESIEYIAINQLGTTLLQTSTPTSLILGCLAFASLVGAMSGIWPAWKASRLNTVDALRYE